MTCTRHASLIDFCCVQHHFQQLVITARGFHGVDAYDLTSSRLEWSVIGRLPGMTKGICAWAVTTDTYGQIFVSDKGNTCVQVVATDGLHLRTIRKPELGQLLGLRWVSRTGYLICSHRKDEMFHISVIREMTEQEENEVPPVEAPTVEVPPVETLTKVPPVEAQLEEVQLKSVTPVDMPADVMTIEPQQEPPTREPAVEEKESSQEVSDLELSITEDMDISDNEDSDGEIIVVDSTEATMPTGMVDPTSEQTEIGGSLAENTQTETTAQAVQDNSLE